MKKIIPFIIIMLLAISFIGAIAYISITKEEKAPISGEYFDDNATVLYFFSENCTHCVEQKAILSELAKEGYRVKPVDVFEPNSSQIVSDYSIEGTPTFASSKDREKLVGLQKKEALRDWLDQHR